MEQIFKDLAINIRVYTGQETIIDPYEKNRSVVLNNPLPIKAIVTDLTANKIQYTMIGIVTDSAKEIIAEKKYLPLMKLSQKIEINNEFYYGYRLNGKLSYRTEGNYIRLYIYSKKV